VTSGARAVARGGTWIAASFVLLSLTDGVSRDVAVALFWLQRSGNGVRRGEEDLRVAPETTTAIAADDLLIVIGVGESLRQLAADAAG